MDSWKFLDARRLEVGGVSCLAVRISYTGELGWELYPAMADMKQLYRWVLGYPACRYASLLYLYTLQRHHGGWRGPGDRARGHQGHQHAQDREG